MRGEGGGGGAGPPVGQSDGRSEGGRSDGRSDGRTWWEEKVKGVVGGRARVTPAGKVTLFGTTNVHRSCGHTIAHFIFPDC